MKRAAAALVRAWYAGRPTFAAIALRPLSWVFGGVAALRRGAYRAHLLRAARVGRPVVVVGNITAGGAGKTPLVAALVAALAARGRRPGVLSRGYGRRAHDTRIVRPGDDSRDVGDEPLLLAASGVPVAVGRARVAAARALLAAHPDVDVLVADDGLQHYALARDVEIVVIDAVRGLGNGLLLPAGPLREPLSRLASVDAIVRRERSDRSQLPSAAEWRPPTRSGVREFVASAEPQPWVHLLDPARTFDAAALADPASVAIAGIADPAAFFDALRMQGFRGEAHAFPDHHRYTRGDMAFPHAPAILMTEKDAVKCRTFADARMWMQPMRARIPPALVDFVLERIDGPEAPRNARLPGDEGSADP